MADTAGPDPARRRLDRLTAPDLLVGVTERSLKDVRALRDECREEEARLSYTRRLLQARLDIARAEVARRAEGGTGDLLKALPAILADSPTESPIGNSRVAPLYGPDRLQRGDRRASDSLLSDATLVRLPDLSDDELVALVDRLAAEERGVSDLRRRLLTTLDGLQADLVRRYQSGVAVDDILSASVGRGAGGGRQPTD